MSLVAYAADSDSDGSDNEQDDNQIQAVVIKPKTVQNGDKGYEDNISDEEDFVHSAADNGIVSDDFFESKEQDLMSLISEKLPNAKLKSTEKASFVDEAEDVSSIPQKKDYGDKIEEPPAKKKKKTGPVQIVLPALAKLDEDEEKDKVRMQPSKTGSGLFSLLPAPKNSFTRKPAASVMQSESAAKTPALSETSNENNLKPQGVRKVGLIPHRVANPVKKPVPAKTDKSDSEDDDDDDYLNVNSSSSSYFPDNPVQAGPSVGPSININPVPGGSVYNRYPGATPVHNYTPDQMLGPAPVPSYTPDQMLGPAVAPYPPPEPTYPGPGQVDSEEALMRLAGKQNKMKEWKEDPNMKIMDVHEDDMRGDPRVWLTKAMTEEQAPRPTGKGPKGLAKSRHQITYLAHQAKERDWELRQEWATARENKRASANKYGF